MPTESLTEEDILQQIITPCLRKAEESIPFFSLKSAADGVVLYGGPGALLDSLNLVSFVFLLEEQVLKTWNREIHITTQDVLDSEASPFLSLSHLASFLLRKIKTRD